MGVRPYDPAIGRFLATDPIEGGSLNAYDYAGQNPIDSYDLDGRWCRACARWMHDFNDGLRRSGKILTGAAAVGIGTVLVSYHGKKHVIDCAKAAKKWPGYTGLAIATVACPAIAVTPKAAGGTLVILGGCLVKQGVTGRENCAGMHLPPRSQPNRTRIQ